MNKILAILIFLMLITPVTVAYCIEIKRNERLSKILENYRGLSKDKDYEIQKLICEKYKLDCELEAKQSELDDALSEIETFNKLLKDVKLKELEEAEEYKEVPQDAIL